MSTTTPSSFLAVCCPAARTGRGNNVNATRIAKVRRIRHRSPFRAESGEYNGKTQLEQKKGRMPSYKPTETAGSDGVKLLARGRHTCRTGKNRDVKSHSWGAKRKQRMQCGDLGFGSLLQAEKIDAFLIYQGMFNTSHSHNIALSQGNLL